MLAFQELQPPKAKESWEWLNFAVWTWLATWT